MKRVLTFLRYLSLNTAQQANITAYQSGFWTGGSDEASSSRGAIPAWIYTIGTTSSPGSTPYRASTSVLTACSDSVGRDPSDG